MDVNGILITFICSEISILNAHSVGPDQRLMLNFTASDLCLHSLPGPGCSKLTMSLVNDLLKFQTLISQICQYFLSKK